MVRVVHRQQALFAVLVIAASLLISCSCENAVEENDKVHRSDVMQCRITEQLYKEVRLLPDNKRVKKCSTPGCFFIYPPREEEGFMPARLTSGNRLDKTMSAVQGCRSDIPFILQRAAFSKDTKLRKLLRYLRACFVFDKEVGDIHTKQCQQEWTNKTEALSRRSWLEQNVYYAENRCFRPFHKAGVFYATFGHRSEGRVICCSDGRLDGDDFQLKQCMPITEMIYAGKREGGWRKGKDAQ